MSTVICRWNGRTNPRLLTGRHEDTCADETCAGCQACPESHCGVCQRAHAEGTCPECTAVTRDDLREIGRLCGSLPAEVEHRGVNGEAMMLLGPAADPEAWRNRAMSATMGRLPEGYLDDCRDEAHPMWVLGTWEQVWRDELGHVTDLKATLPRLVDYLDREMHVMAGRAEPPFEDFARDVRGCRAHLEDVLMAGERVERTEVPCLECGTLLVKVHKDAEDRDGYECQRKSCDRTWYDQQEFTLAKAEHLKSEGADKFVPLTTALAAIGRPEQTVRTWVRNGAVDSKRDEQNRVVVWWPDVRRMHLLAETRKRVPKQPTYNGAHQLIRRESGPASARACVDCAEPAREWSFVGNPASAQRGTNGCLYSTDPNDYVPRCKPCHVRHDAQQRLTG